ncbi:hypothetical protein P9281_05180 [Caballeronia sp. LP003]|uniref:hypothetical protein n=1 Tax=Caballeronia sp. LP003 TaxID=3038551 RepID=UPI0028586DD2|nr:hypothetical protein [Caballeronia sp. LP003]MDR5785946.1 hypothetical protein [Caballeronia sp. LP003]
MLEHELAERVKRRIELRRVESHLDPAKTLDTFDFSVVPMVLKAHITALASDDRGWRKAPRSCCLGLPAAARHSSVPPSDRR